MKYRTFSDLSGLRPRIDALSAASWPKFLLRGSDISHWDLLFGEFAEVQVVFLDGDGNLAAVGHGVPLAWDGTTEGLPRTIDEILVRAEDDRRMDRAPDAYCALAAMVSPRHRGEGLSAAIVEAMRSVAAPRGCTSLIAPVRPIWKARYPLTSMERYVAWFRPDGSPFDPWIRTHWKMGAIPLGLAPATCVVEAPVARWEEWTEIPFPESGPYVVPGALQPVWIDREGDRGRYEDPNLWMRHAVIRACFPAPSRSRVA